MCAVSPGIVREGHHLGELQVMALYHPANRHGLTTLRQVVTSSLGPGGQLKMIHNNVGGHVTVTSSSAKLLQSLSSSNSIIQLIVAATQGHVTNYSDGGLLAAVLCLNLIENSLDLDIHRHLVIEIYEVLAQHCMEYLADENCTCVNRINVCDLPSMLAIIRGVVGSKHACGLTTSEVDLICHLVLSAVLRVCPSNGYTEYGPIQHLAIEGMPVSQSHMLEGIMFPAPHIPVYRNKALVFRKDHIDKPGWIKVALFNISLAGDTTDHCEEKYEMPQGLDAGKVVVSQMERCAESLISLDIGLVVCQKVVHPHIKKCLRNAGVWVLDRLSINYIHAAHALTGNGIFLGP